MERLGEKIAAKMVNERRNQLIFTEVENMIPAKSMGNCDDDYRVEWSSLFALCKLLGLKLESKVSSRNQGKKDLNVTFRHETYKNYYLLRGLKRIFSRKTPTKNIKNVIPEKEDKFMDVFILTAVLDNRSTLQNFELMRFFGEDVKYSKDRILRQNLYKILKEEQVKAKSNKYSSISDNPNDVRAAVVISLLIAGCYSFALEDLSELNLSGAYMRGGIFSGGIFKKTNLRNSNLRYANLSEAKFLDSDITNLDLEALPYFMGHRREVTSVCISKDGKRVASGSYDSNGAENFVILWDSSTAKSIHTFCCSYYVYSVSFSPDGKKLAGTDDQNVIVWDTITGETLLKLQGHEQIVLVVYFSKDGLNLLSGSQDKTVRIWDSTSGECYRILECHLWSKNIRFSSDCRPVAFSDDLKSWNFERQGGDKISFSSDGKKIATIYENIIQIWDIMSSELILNLSGHSHSVNCVSFSQDGLKIVSGGEDKKVKIWDSLNGNCLQTIDAHQKSVLATCFSEDGKIVISGGNDNLVKRWIIEGGTSVQLLEGHKFDVTSICFSSDEKRIASGSFDCSVNIWDCETGECLRSLRGHCHNVGCVSFNKEGNRLVSGSADCTVRIWNIDNGECILNLVGHESEIESVCFNNDDSKIASGCPENDQIFIWNSETGQYLMNLDGSKNGWHYVRLNMIWFTKDEKVVASYSNDTVRVWDLEAVDYLEREINADEVRSRNTCLSSNGNLKAEAINGAIKLFEKMPIYKKWVLKRLFKAEEEIFTCKGAVFEKCKIEGETDKVDTFKQTVKQQLGKFIGKALR